MLERFSIVHIVFVGIMQKAECHQSPVKENEDILSKINDIDKSIKALEAKEFETENFIEKLMEVEKKLDNFTNVRQDTHTKDEIIDNLTKKVTEMEENVKEKDVLINDLVSRIKIVEDKQDAFEKEVEKGVCEKVLRDFL